jgi:pilus assembly protein Flp/PilA
MKTLNHFLRRLRDNRSGATIIEYCLIAGFISIAVVSGATAIGQNTNGSFNAVQEGFDGP